MLTCGRYFDESAGYFFRGVVNNNVWRVIAPEEEYYVATIDGEVNVPLLGMCAIWSRGVRTSRRACRLFDSGVVLQVRDWGTAGMTHA